MLEHTYMLVYRSPLEHIGALSFCHLVAGHTQFVVAVRELREPALDQKYCLTKPHNADQSSV